MEKAKINKEQGKVDVPKTHKNSLTMMEARTPRPKRNDAGNKSSASHWHDIQLSPAPSWTPAPPAVQLGDDEISPTSVATPRSHFFSFATSTPKPLKKYFTPKPTTYSRQQQQTRQYGHLTSDAARPSRSVRQTHSVIAVVLAAALFYVGSSCWSTLLEQSQDPPSSSLVPPPRSLSAKAKAAFSRLYPRDFGAAPALWVVMEASVDKRVLAEPKFNSLGGGHLVHDDSHSFTDDTSAVYSQGKEFSFGLSDYLVEQFQANHNIDSVVEGEESSASVQVTTYYSLQEQGLDYTARNMVSPDGSKTMIQIQYLQDELGQDGIHKLKETILDYGRENQPSYLELHYTGQTWNPPPYKSRGSSYGLGILTVGAFLVGTFLVSKLGRWHPAAQWCLLAGFSMASSLSVSAIVLTHVLRISTTTPLALSAMTMVSSLLSIYFSKVQIDNFDDDSNNVATKAVRSAILHSGMVLVCALASLYTFSSPTLQSVSVATVVAVTNSVLFHVFLAPMLLDTMHVPSNSHKTYRSPFTTKMATRQNAATSSKRRSLIVLVVTGLFFLPVAYQSMRLPNVLLDGIAPTAFLTGLAAQDRFRTMGESMGHGRLTPYRIVFDGHKRNQSLVSLGGYDIVQMVVDELVGISISDSSDGEEEVGDDPGLAGSTHIGEEFQEVQHLIKDLVDTLKRFKEEQQREFDHHHQRRQTRWEHHQEMEESDMEDVRCDYNVNSGLHATTYSGIAVVENSRIPQSLYSAANICRRMDPRCPSEALHLLNVLEDSTTTSNHLATYVNVNLGVDPFSWKGIEWLRLARETVRRLQEDPRILGGVEVHIDGPAAVAEDLYSSQHRRLPRQLFVAFGILVAVLGISYGNVLLPLQIMASICCTLAFTLGAGRMIYQNGVLNWTHLSSLSSMTRETEGGGITAFPETMVCLLIVAAVLVVNILAARLKRPQSSLLVITALAAGTLCLVDIVLSTSRQNAVQWPLLVAVGLLFEEVWVRGFVLPAFTEMWLKAPAMHLEKLNTKFGCDIPEHSNQHEAYLERFESFVRSPQAP